ADGLRRIDAGDAGRGLGRLAVAAWLAIPYPYPWYGLWFLPLAVTLGRGQGSALLGGTFASAARYIPDMVGTLGPMLRFFVTLVELAPLLLAAGLPLVGRAGRRRRAAVSP
ncbi:MAG: hypothetical protein ACREM6_15120, partial [Vulcanimicrobiaceae bacterium]